MAGGKDDEEDKVAVSSEDKPYKSFKRWNLTTMRSTEKKELIIWSNERGQIYSLMIPDEFTEINQSYLDT